jgi:hypothetical protein
MAIGLAVVGGIFAALSALLLTDIYGARLIDVLVGQSLTISAIMGVGAAVVAATFFVGAAIVATLQTTRRPD